VKHNERTETLPQESKVPQGQAPAATLAEEIARTETRMAECAAQMEKLLTDDSVVLGRLLQMRNEQLELKAYIRGLKFKAGLNG
jgi:uncharacterized membrane-anchored protein